MMNGTVHSTGKKKEGPSVGEKCKKSLDLYGISPFVYSNLGSDRK